MVLVISTKMKLKKAVCVILSVNCIFITNDRVKTTSQLHINNIATSTVYKMTEFQLLAIHSH